MPDELPDFASQWIQQWKQAAPKLQAIRDEELRRRDGSCNRRVAGEFLYERNPERHGMVIMQRWFMRRQLLELARQQQSNPDAEY